MNLLPRIRKTWPGWLVWGFPVSVGLIVIGYQVFCQVVLNSARPLPIFWGDTLVFGVIGPAIVWALLRQLALNATDSRSAAEQINELIVEERRRAQELTVLYAVSSAMDQSLSKEDALAGALDRILDVLDLEGGKIYLCDPQTAQSVLSTARGRSASSNPDETVIAPGQCPGDLSDLSQPSADVMSSERPNDWQRQRDGSACASVPLMAKERMLGVMYVTSRRARDFGQSDMALLRSVGAQIGMAVENMRLREEARRAEALSTLIQEMHHRIKNNLQTVADLLGLEMAASPSPAARKSLRDSIGRIKSIAAVHELLSLEQLRLTDITELARQVCDISLRHMVRPDRQVIAEVSGPAIYLPSKQATALALVMNELISNALEHAFSMSGRDGQLAINTAQDGAQVTVTIADNGRGLPQDFGVSGRRGLGLQIVYTLVEKDLNGRLQLENRPEGGSRAMLTFYK